MQELKSLKNLLFDRPFSCNVYDVWPKKVQRSYLSWGFLKTTNQPTTFHQPTTNRPPTTEHQPTDHRPSAPTIDQPTINQ